MPHNTAGELIDKLHGEEPNYLDLLASPEMDDLDEEESCFKLHSVGLTTRQEIKTNDFRMLPNESDLIEDGFFERLMGKPEISRTSMYSSKRVVENQEPAPQPSQFQNVQ